MCIRTGLCAGMCGAGTPPSNCARCSESALYSPPVDSSTSRSKMLMRPMFPVLYRYRNPYGHAIVTGRPLALCRLQRQRSSVGKVRRRGPGGAEGEAPSVPARATPPRGLRPDRQRHVGRASNPTRCAVMRMCRLIPRTMNSTTRALFTPRGGERPRSPISGPSATRDRGHFLSAGNTYRRPS
jgi:hypothetical protein